MRQRWALGLATRPLLTDADRAAVRRLAAICDAQEGLDLELHLDVTAEQAGDQTTYALCSLDSGLVGFAGLDLRPRSSCARWCTRCTAASPPPCAAREVLLICEAASRSGQAFVAAIGARYRSGELRLVLAEPRPYRRRAASGWNRPGAGTWARWCGCAPRVRGDARRSSAGD